ncbi:MAG: aromatic ring-hydroxylating dioxygenase subunit alpha [Candidatus Obscuribacter sp.]|nr:aromatic ring-hydroxylating dioxygenase subunit alpha [Candidatus Obscuribacter sp.]MBP7575547.1 aromatic ring-hydroxylating dioxygenase subunit alpha [Candidatus Obscuribacter sp.]
MKKSEKKTALTEPDSKVTGLISADTMPATFYRSEELYLKSLDQIFATSWQILASHHQLPLDQHAAPFTLLEGALNEPLLLVRDGKTLSCLSNVCTHRGAILVEQGCQSRSLRCRYHGRRFNLDGQFQSAPGFENIQDFPRDKDHLPKVSHQSWGPFSFVSLSPACSFDQWIGDVQKRLAFMPFAEFVFRPDLSRDFDIDAHWALYVDNYLEGLHIPFVHPSLTSVLDLKGYQTELLPYGNLQIGASAPGSKSFELPEHSPDYGKQISAYYYWLFPNLMLNFYTWGLSVNIVMPQGHNKTKVRFLTYVWRPELMEGYSPADIVQTEMEDEAVVQSVQQGIQSRLYKSGRYAPQWEAGVKQFHDILRSKLGT